MPVPWTIFDILDVNQDGELSRSELHTVAKDLGWYWKEAPLFALLDYLTVSKPLSKDRFIEILQQMAGDPMGPYGDVLLKTPGAVGRVRPRPVGTLRSQSSRLSGTYEAKHSSVASAVAYLSEHAGLDVSNAYGRLLGSLGTLPLSRGRAALVIIDPQRSFISGAWMRSIGSRAESDVAPIRLAFDQCAMVLDRLYGRMEVMFSRCPFPPGSYDWCDPLADILDDGQPYVIKPGNSILFPPTNGFRPWIDRCIDEGIRSLVIGGCTLNSCVRVSSMEVQSLFPAEQLQVIVDVSLCGARGKNYLPSPEFGGVSPAGSALEQMANSGVSVVKRVRW
ncbi:hypothetical protein D3OALGB2SA_2132 [Olavius algarvensis associated proteobacterium Delta 3]|nr:hypothetical protein D3OALGB2SA_2132 [Olavius algarvensis associated proteobacterium Delta 3]